MWTFSCCIAHKYTRHEHMCGHLVVVLVTELMCVHLVVVLLTELMCGHLVVVLLIELMCGHLVVVLLTEHHQANFCSVPLKIDRIRKIDGLIDHEFINM